DERHRLQALAPDGAYFAGRSTVEVGAGDTPRFEIRQGSARLSGTVRDDAGGPLAGVLLRLAGAQAGETASTDSSGHYAFSPAPGEFTLSLDAGSLPPGYDAADAAPRTVRLVQSEPAHLEWIVPAGRSIAGTVVITPRHAVPVWLVGTDRKIVARPDGAFVFRNLRPGIWTVAADLDGAEVHEVVRVPEGPAVVHVELRRPVPASPAKR
ncbi:MAG: MSCRAMM family protein, partial [Myxococcales bacterium]